MFQTGALGRRRQGNTIIFVPFSSEKVLRIGSVMTASKTTVVIVNGEKIVNEILPFARAGNAAAEIQPLDRKID